MRLVVGLVIGVLVGASAMYLGLRRPWQAPADTPAVTPSRSGEGAPGVPGATKARPRKSSARTSPSMLEDRAPVDLTEDERKLQWRGDEVALPARTLELSSDDDDGRPLDDGEIQATISRGGNTVIACIQAAAPGSQLAAPVTLKMLVSASGRVDRLRVQAPRYLHDHGLLPCLRRAAAKLDFPATGAPTVVSAPFELE